MGDKTLESELMACKEELKEANEQIEYLKSLKGQIDILLEKLQNSPNFKPNPTDKDKSFFERMREYFQ